MLKGAGTHVASDAVIHGLLSLSLWTHCEAEHHGREGRAKQNAHVGMGLETSKIDRKEPETRYALTDVPQWRPSPKCPFP